jgi:hypothetical protein
LTPSRRLVVKIVAKNICENSLLQHDEKHVVSTALEIRVEKTRRIKIEYNSAANTGIGRRLFKF